MIINKNLVIYGVAVLLVAVLAMTTYKTINSHHGKLNVVVSNKIIAAAKRCYYEEKCVNEKILLKDLYELNYIEKVSDPVSKEYYKEESYVLREGTKFSFVLVN